MCSKKGFTLIELLVVVAIISLLSSVVITSLSSARSKARFADVIETMRSIEQAATLDYNDYGTFAPDVGPAQNTRFVPTYLKKWPTPPCSGWTYDWENWDSNNEETVRVTLRRPDVSSVYYYCIATRGNCRDGNGSNMKTLTNKTLSCN